MHGCLMCRHPCIMLVQFYQVTNMLAHQPFTSQMVELTKQQIFLQFDLKY